MDVFIRDMEEKDIRAVQKVAKSSWHATYEDIIPFPIQERFLQSAYSKETMIRRLATSFLFVAETENNVVGFANFSTVAKNGETELGAIYLDPEYQGRGIGTSLLKHGISQLSGVK